MAVGERLTLHSKSAPRTRRKRDTISAGKHKEHKVHTEVDRAHLPEEAVCDLFKRVLT